MLELVIAGVRLIDRCGLVDIGIKKGKIVAIEQDLRDAVIVTNGHGQLAFPGLVECHVHLDKAMIMDRCSIVNGTLQEAVETVGKAKTKFTEQDVYERAKQVLNLACGHGVTQMRTFAEVDAYAELRSFHALKNLREDQQKSMDLEICAFAQDGTTGTRAGLDFLISALEEGADLVGGCPYTDKNPLKHISDIFDLAERFDVPVDLHLDFSLNPTQTHLPKVIEETRNRGFGGRVTLGHVTTLSAMKRDRVKRIAGQLAEAGISVVALPATDLFLMGRGSSHSVPRGIAPLDLLAEEGVNVAVSSNNLLNPFTPSGDCNPLRMAELFMHVAQLRSGAELRTAFDMVAANAAKVMGKEHKICIGGDANIVLIDAACPGDVLRRGVAPSTGWFRGQKTFKRQFEMAFTEYTEPNSNSQGAINERTVC